MTDNLTYLLVFVKTRAKNSINIRTWYTRIWSGGFLETEGKGCQLRRKEPGFWIRRGNLDLDSQANRNRKKQ